jgi:hypothetical protein
MYVCVCVCFLFVCNWVIYNLIRFVYVCVCTVYPSRLCYGFLVPFCFSITFLLKQKKKIVIISKTKSKYQQFVIEQYSSFVMCVNIKTKIISCCNVVHSLAIRPRPFYYSYCIITHKKFLYCRRRRHGGVGHSIGRCWISTAAAAVVVVCVCCIPSCNRMEKEKRVATSGSQFLITIR